MTHFMLIFNRESDIKLDKEFDKEFDIKSWRMLSIELFNICYEACIKHTMK